MDVAGAWRRVENKVVQFSPVSIGNQLFQRVRRHASAPERSSIGRDEETYGEHLDAVGFDGTNQVAAVHVDSVGSFVLNVEHLRHRRSENVAIQQSDLIPQTCQCDGQVGRNGAFAYAALARADGDDVLHLRQQLSYFGTRFRLEFRPYLHLDGDFGSRTAEHTGAVVFDSSLGSLHRRLQKGVGIAGEFQHHRHFVAVNGGLVSHHLALHQVLLRAGIRHRCQRVHNQFGI